MGRETDKQIGAAAAVMRSLYWSVMVKKELSQKTNLSTGQSMSLPSPMVINFGS